MTFESILPIAFNITAKTLVLAIFVFVAAKQILYWIWLWQLKEYRTDRMIAHLELFPTLKQKLLLFLGYYGLKSMRMPHFTKKAMLITASVFLLYILFLKPVIGLNIFDAIITFLILYLIIPLIVLAIIDAVNIISSFEKDKIIKKAHKKIKNMPDLLIIGVTGSYGKSSVKEILAALLEKKFKTLKTPENINTPIGIAQIIIEKLKNDHQIFIVEMGAYKKGEIEEICKIVPPKIGILTGINEQHLALFGNLHKTTDAKFELIKALPFDGIAILNYDNINIKEKMKNLTAVEYDKNKIKKQKFKQLLAVKNTIYYSATEKTNIYADKILAGKGELEFEVTYQNKKETFCAPLAGMQNVYNILAAASAAVSLGIELSEIASIVKNLHTRSKTMAEYEAINGSVLIADTYNSNPNGVIAALDYLNFYNGRKIVVIGGIIELGKASKEIHEKIGRKIAKCADIAILANPVFAEYITTGAINEGMSENNIILAGSKNIIPDIVNRFSGKGDAVLLCGRDADKALEELRK